MPDISNHIEEMQQMMGRIPGWIIRWGLWIIGLIFIGVLIGCYLIKYPETISGTVELTAYNPPTELLAKRSGRIAQLFVKEGDLVKDKTHILVLENAADYNEVIYIDSLLKIPIPWTEQIFNEQLYQEFKLGDIQNYFLQFQKECAALKEYLQSPLNADKEKILKQQIIKQQELLNFQKKQFMLNKKDFELTQKNFQRDSTIYIIDGISRSQYEKSQQQLLQKEATLINQQSIIGNTEASLLSLQGNLIENQTQNQSQIRTYCLEIARLHQQLMTQIDTWYQEYLLTAPVSGTIFLSNVWSKNQNVTASERVATIVPQDSAVVMGRMSVPFSGYSKIEVGQCVQVRLDNYPYLEFGRIQGQVRSVSPIPEPSGYIVRIDFPHGLITSYGIPVTYVYKMTGTADIITKDMRLIEQFIQPIKAIWERL